jgi:uncharacterized phage protein (TIGR02218 family)
MPRTISAGLNAHKQEPVTTLTRCAKIKRTDGEIFAYTLLDQDVTINISDGDGSITYQSVLGPTISAIVAASGLQPDNLAITGPLSDDAIDSPDIRAGLYDFAEVTVFECNYEDTSQGASILFYGHWGEVEIRDNEFTVQFRPLTDHYAQKFGMLTQPGCRHELGDENGSKCGVRLVPSAWAALTAYTVRQARDAKTGSVVRPTTQNGRHFKCTTAGTSGASEPSWNTTVGGTTTDGTVTWTTILALSQTGTVTSVVDRSNFTSSGISFGADWWTEGVVEWLTGNNAGFANEVKDDNGTGTLELKIAAAYTPVIGDTFRVKAGCNLIHDHASGCSGKFDNIYNFGGEPFVPGADVALDYPDAQG